MPPRPSSPSTSWPATERSSPAGRQACAPSPSATVWEGEGGPPGGSVAVSAAGGGTGVTRPQAGQRAFLPAAASGAVRVRAQPAHAKTVIGWTLGQTKRPAKRRALRDYPAP